MPICSGCDAEFTPGSPHQDLCDECEGAFVVMASNDPRMQDCPNPEIGNPCPYAEGDLCKGWVEGHGPKPPCQKERCAYCNATDVELRRVYVQTNPQTRLACRDCDEKIQSMGIFDPMAGGGLLSSEWDEEEE